MLLFTYFSIYISLKPIDSVFFHSCHNFNSLSIAKANKRPTEHSKLTFEDWASEPQSSSATLMQQPQPYTETVFEDWVQRREMSYQDDKQHQLESVFQPQQQDDVTDSDEISQRDVIEGDIEVRVDIKDSEEVQADGTTVTRQIVTRRRVCPITEYLTVNGVRTCAQTTDRLINVEIDEDVLVLPAGGSDDISDDMMTETKVTVQDDQLDDGTPVQRRVTTTTVLSQQKQDNNDDVEIQQQAAVIVNESVEAALKQIESTDAEG